MNVSSYFPLPTIGQSLRMAYQHSSEIVPLALAIGAFALGILWFRNNAVQAVTKPPLIALDDEREEIKKKIRDLENADVEPSDQRRIVLEEKHANVNFD